METKTNRFDPETAKRIKKNVAGSPHAAFADADGNICLLARGRLPGGGVAINMDALHWLDDQKGGRFIRAIDQTTGFDRLAALEDLPNDHHPDDRDYIVLDPEDFEEVRFPPLPASVHAAPF